MTEKKKIPKMNLKDQKIVNQFRDKLSRIIIEDKVDHAYRLSVLLLDQLRQSPELRQIDPDLYAEYEKMIITAQWVAFPLSSRGLARSLLKEHLSAGLSIEDFPILGKLRTRLINEMEITARDKFKKDLLNHLIRNSERLTKEAITRDGKIFPPTVERWIQEFNNSVGVEDVGDRLKEAQFFSRNKNLKKLSPDERRQIEILMRIYERLSLPSSTAVGLEEAIPIDDPGRQGVLRDGVYEPIKPNEMKGEIERAMAIEEEVNKTDPDDESDLTFEDRKRDYIAQIPEITDEATKIGAETNGQFEPIVKKFKQFLEQGNSRGVVAALYFLASSGQFKDFLKQAIDLLDGFEMDLAAKYADTDLIAYAKSKPEDSAIFKEILEYLLQNKLGMTENEAVLVGLDLGRMLGPEYEKIGYGDRSTEKFVWTKSTVQNGILVMGQVPEYVPPTEKPIVPTLVPEEEKTEESEEFETVGDPLELLKQKYKNYRAQRKAVLEVEDELSVRARGNAEMLKKELAAAVRNGEKYKVIASLKLLARQGDLKKALQDNQSWFEAVTKYIHEKYSEKYSKEDIKQAISDLKINATTPAGISEFLQYLLREKLKMDEDQSALVGIEIGQLLGKNYQGIAYGNEKTGSFEWTTNQIKDRRLVSEI